LVKIITTHLSADFDAFASAVCAVRLFPGHRVLFPGSMELAVRQFRTEVTVPFPEVKLKEARRSLLEHAVVLDTPDPARLGEVWDLIREAGCPVTRIDHHGTNGGGIAADELIFRRVGSTCTLIVDLFRTRAIAPTPEEASLLLMGIYEDTGSLSFRDTTSEDMEAAAWLLENGASLAWVRRWVAKSLEPEQLELLNAIVEGTEERRIGGVPVAVATVEVERYHEEAAAVVHRWMETFRMPVGVVLMVRAPMIQMIFRSRLAGLDVGAIARSFGGGGHATAASARVGDRMVVEIREEVWRHLVERMPPPETAGDAAGRNIFTVDDDVTVGAAKEKLNSRRVNALPVAQASDGLLVGGVTRQLLDGASSLGLDHRPVSTVMQPGVPTVDAGTPLEELGDFFLDGSHRFVIVTENGKTVGLLTRMELFRRLFEKMPAVGAGLDHRMAGLRPVTQTVTRLLREAAPEWVARLTEVVRDVADHLGSPTYLVGGVVRDLLLERSNEDVDLVVEGDGIEVAKALAEKLGGRCHAHQPFMTAVVTLADGHTVDVASARTEFYRTPAALPEVVTSLIRQDLYRRDFTINALAISLDGRQFGRLIDFFGGRRDLSRREIRVLHSLSFIDDPTRAIRAVRYARRLDFEVAADTGHLIQTAVSEGVFERLSGQRLRRELEQLLAEPHPTPAMAMLADLGLLEAICPDLTWDEGRYSFLLEVEGQLSWYLLERLGDTPPPLFLFLGGLAAVAGDGAVAHVAQRLSLTGAAGRRMVGLRRAIEKVKAVAEAGVALSRRVFVVESSEAEALLLAMAQLGLEGRRSLAEAAEAAVRRAAPLSGRDLLDAGVSQCRHIGPAIKTTRAALLDGVIDEDGALEFAVQTVRNFEEVE
jgi:tRNA nucleotidyltransferase (CCA-adding enzyme)